jgi:hypothetical protein
MNLELERDGAQLFPRALHEAGLANLEDILPKSSTAGQRLYGKSGLRHGLSDGSVGRIARTILGPSAQPVRAVLFSKTPEMNWALGWHQDRTIAVRERIDVAGFTNWNTKAGAIHVEPPFNVIERMMTMRIHIDGAPENNAPLLIAPGSHLLGRIPEDEIEQAVERSGTYVCLADAGDIWVYRTAILHASKRSAIQGRRRVLQVDFTPEELPDGLEWLGVG